MLRRIRIQNHALIHEVEMTLEEGFHVFTGETGSGKSILLGAIGLLLGDRADTLAWSYGDRAIIEVICAPSSKMSGRICPWLDPSPCRKCCETDGQGVHQRRPAVGQPETWDHLVHITARTTSAPLWSVPLQYVLDLAGNHTSVKGSYDKAYAVWCEAKEALQWA